MSLFITSWGTPKFAERIEKPAADERRLGEAILVPTHGHSRWLPGELRLAAQIAEPSGGIIIPVVVAIAHQDQGLLEAKARRDEIDDTLHALGLEGDCRIRVDRTVSEGIQQAALENDASLVLLGWQGPRPITTYFVESVTDEVSRLVDCPVAVAAISETPIEQVVLAIAKSDLNAPRLERLKAAVRIATAVAAHEPLVVGPVSPEVLSDAGIVLPEKTEYQPSNLGIFPWIEENSKKNSLVVTTSRSWAFDRIVAEINRLEGSVVTITSK